MENPKTVVQITKHYFSGTWVNMLMKKISIWVYKFVRKRWKDGTQNIWVWRTLIYEDTQSAPSGRWREYWKKKWHLWPREKNCVPLISYAFFLCFYQFLSSRDATLEIKVRVEVLLVWGTGSNMKVYCKQVSFQRRDLAKLPWILSGSRCKILHV